MTRKEEKYLRKKFFIKSKIMLIRCISINFGVWNYVKHLFLFVLEKKINFDTILSVSSTVFENNVFENSQFQFLPKFSTVFFSYLTKARLIRKSSGLYIQMKFGKLSLSESLQDMDYKTRYFGHCSLRGLWRCKSKIPNLSEEMKTIIAS